MIDATLQVVTFVAAAAILIRAEPALARADEHTPFAIGFAAHFLTVGGLGVCGSILFGYVPALPVTIALVGIAALLLCGRRVEDLRIPHPPKHEEPAP